MKVLTTKDFKTFYSKPHKVFKGKNLVLKVQDNPESKVGFSVPKKVYPKAHDRNLRKRWLREIFKDMKFSGWIEIKIQGKVNSLEEMKLELNSFKF